MTAEELKAAIAARVAHATHVVETGLLPLGSLERAVAYEVLFTWGERIDGIRGRIERLARAEVERA